MAGTRQSAPKQTTPRAGRAGRQRRRYLSRQDQLESLTSPVRHQIHQTLEVIGPCPVRELAERLGRAPEALYYHIRRLLKAGVIVEVGKQRSGRRSEAVFDVAGRPLLVDPTITSPRYLDAIVRTAAARLRLAERCLRRTILARDAVRKGPMRSFRVEQNNVRLSTKSLKELNRRISELVTFLSEHDDPEAEQFHTITIASGWSETGGGSTPDP